MNKEKYKKEALEELKAFNSTGNQEIIDRLIRKIKETSGSHFSIGYDLYHEICSKSNGKLSKADIERLSAPKKPTLQDKEIDELRNRIYEIPNKKMAAMGYMKALLWCIDSSIPRSVILTEIMIIGLRKFIDEEKND